MATYMDTSAQDSSSRELHVDDIEDAKTSLEDGSEEELANLLGRVKSAAASLRYLRSLGVEQQQLEDGSSVIEDGDSYSWKMLQSIEIVTDVLESLSRRVTAAESETWFQKERVVSGEEEIRRKTVQIENLCLKLEEMKGIVHGNKTVLDETEEIIKKLVEDSRRDREKAVENEEELRRVKAECESLRNYVNTSPNVVETLLSSEGQFHSMMVAKSTQLEGEKAQKEVEVQKLMAENLKLTALLDKKEAQLLALNEQCKVMALNASNI